MKRVALLLLALLVARSASAQSFTMPLPSPDLPDGVVTVKVVGSGMEDRKVGQAVILLRSGGAQGPEALQTVKTGDDGRARFEKLEPGSRYLVRVEVDGKSVDSQPFAAPSPGGLRLLLTMGATPAMPGGAPDAPMPPGHPPTSQPASQPVMPPGHPPASQPSAGSSGQSGAATVKPSDELDKGQLLVKVLRAGKKGETPKPLAGAMVIATGGAKGGGHPRTDKEGKLLLSFKEDKPGPISVTVIHDSISYRSEALRLPAEGGLEATFTVYNRSVDLRALSIGPGSHIVVQPSEGALSVMQVLQVQNSSASLVDAGAAGLELKLPVGGRSVEVPEEEKDLLSADAENARVKVISPLPPGRTVIRIYFEVPYEGAELDYRQKMPLRAAEGLVMVRGKNRLSLGGPSLKGPDPQAEDAFVLTSVEAGKDLEFTISGLPHHERRAAWVTIALACLLVLWAAGAAWAGPRHARDRTERREALLKQLVQLQRGKPRGEATAQRRKELLAELREVWEER